MTVPCFSRSFASWQIVSVNVNKDSRSSVKDMVDQLREQNIACNGCLDVLAFPDTGTRTMFYFALLELQCIGSDAGRAALCLLVSTRAAPEGNPPSSNAGLGGKGLGIGPLGICHPRDNYWIFEFETSKIVTGPPMGDSSIAARVRRLWRLHRVACVCKLWQACQLCGGSASECVLTTCMWHVE